MIGADLPPAHAPLDPLNPEGELCLGCGRPAKGSARVNGNRYCHGDYDREPTCYMAASRGPRPPAGGAP